MLRALIIESDARPKLREFYSASHISVKPDSRLVLTRFAGRAYIPPNYSDARLPIAERSFAHVIID